MRSMPWSVALLPSGKSTRSRRPTSPRRRRLPFALPPMLEVLEDRTVLSAGIGVGQSQTDFGSIVPIVQETGRISLSIDGLGTLQSSGTIQVDKPAGATVRKAFLAAATTGFSAHPWYPYGPQPALANGEVKIDGAGVNWGITTPSSIFSYNHWAEVTSLVKTKLDAAPAGLVNFTITEMRSLHTDGEILAVIFDDPNQTYNNTVALLFGAQNITGDTFSVRFAEPINKSDPNLQLDMSLGIGYSFQYPPTPPQNWPEQYSIVNVNGTRLTTSAGGQDDGLPANGALLTVGGIGDTNGNPANALALPGYSARSDDELYNLLPYVTNGATSISVVTQNPSQDDNLFFAAFNLRSATAIIGEGIVLGPTEATNATGTQHTVTATVQNNLGQPLANRQVTFAIVAGPNMGQTAILSTNASGQASFTYTSSTAGNDQIQARVVSTQGQLLLSNTVISRWVASNRAPSVSPGGPYTVPEGGSVNLTALAQDLDDDPVTIAWDLDNDGTFEVSGAIAAFSAIGLDGPTTRTIRVRGDDGHGHVVIATGTVEVTNVAPTISLSGASAILEGSPYTLSLGNVNDPGQDTVSSYRILWGDGTVDTFTGSPNGMSKTHTYDDGSATGTLRTITVELTDEDGTFVAGIWTVTVNNAAPTAVLTAPAAVDEGSTYTVSLTGAADPSGEDTVAGFTYAFDMGDGSGYGTFGTVASQSMLTTDNGSRTVRARIRDRDGGEREYTTTLTIHNVAPTVLLTVPSTGSAFAVGTPITFTGVYSDPGSADTHTAQWSFNGVAKTAATVTSGSVSSSYTFTTPGVYSVQLTVTDDDGMAGMADTINALPALIVVYDPSAGFVIGGGWINSPAGAYTADVTLTGKANFGFVSKYQPGAITPTGQTEFQFKVGNLNFKSTSYDWLVVAGARAQYRGSGTINGTGSYSFLLTAIDGQRPGGGGQDKFRMKIWGPGGIVYDNQMGANDGDDPTTLLGGGSIQIHTGGNGLTAALPAITRTDAVPLSEQALAPLVAEALARWRTTGADTELLTNTVVRIADLPGALLGLADDGTIWLDEDAAGYGWFIDPTPSSDEEFPAGTDSPASGRIDLLTVLTHEFGHLLGHEHGDEEDIMAGVLQAGVRLVPGRHESHGEEKENTLRDFTSAVNLARWLSSAPSPLLPNVSVDLAGESEPPLDLFFVPPIAGTTVSCPTYPWKMAEEMEAVDWLFLQETSLRAERDEDRIRATR